MFCLVIGLGFSESSAMVYDFGKIAQYTNDEVITWSLGQRSIATNRKNVYIVSGGNDVIMFTKSLDGGKTFQSSLQIGDGRYPSIALGKDGAIYVVFTTQSVPYITNSTDGGVTFSAPIYIGKGELANVSVDDNGDVYVVTAGLEGISIFKSIDGGSTFTNLNFPSYSYKYDRSPVITAKEGVLHVTWIRKGNVYFASSKDGGNTFADTVMVSGNLGFIPSDGAPSLAVDSDQKSVYIAWVASIISTKGAITSESRSLYVAKSADEGNTFIVKRIETKSDHAQTPSITTDIAGNIYLTWGDYLVPQSGMDIYFTFSDTGGENFLSPINVTQRHSTTGRPTNMAHPTISVNDAEDALIAFGKYISKSTHCTE